MGYFSLFLFYLAVAAIPAAILWLRGRGWRPRFFGVTVLVAWTGGGWLIMACIALMERDGHWKV
ncbi:MAG: hypothetical protein OSW77_09630 [Proteobacteria bacterium]|jgi:hypothetical protein|nr:hypothetical protein [Pseudomonadota bacterium]